MSHQTARSRTTLALVCALALCASTVPASAAVKPSAASAQRAGSGAKPPARVRFIDAPSSEKPAARAKRLKRECKGRPDAGMCRGYTR